MIGIRGWLLAAAAAVMVIASAAAAARLLSPASYGLMHFADAENEGLVAEGKRLYAGECASCHGRRLQGQLLWQVQDRFAGRRAPALDQTGYAWQHSDEELFAMTKFGRFPTTPPTVKSYMPAFGQALADGRIVATIAYVKATWPLGLRVSQALLNPNDAGMPHNAGKVPWRLPPNCQAALQRAGAAVGFAIEGLPRSRQ